MASALKIDEFEIIHLRGPEFPSPVRPAWAPGSTWRRRDATLVKLTTDDGLVGWGTPGYEATPALEGWIKPRLLGADPFLLEQHARVFRNVGGCWGVEIALWDIIGKAAGQPLYKLWGGYRDRVPGYASCVELRSGEQRGQDAAARLAEGWRAMKLRLHDWTMKQDMAQVEGVRRAMGDGLRRLCSAVEILIAGGENNRGLHELRWLIEQDVYDVIQPEAMVAETLSSLRKIAALGELHRKLVAPHHGGGGLGLAAHLHLACAIPNSTYFEMLCEPPGMSSDDFQWYLQEPLKVNADGDIIAPSKPGLGVEPDADKLARYRVSV